MDCAAVVDFMARGLIIDNLGLELQVPPCHPPCWLLDPKLPPRSVPATQSSPYLSASGFWISMVSSNILNQLGDWCKALVGRSFGWTFLSTRGIVVE